ncbi:MAG: hypothetical protein LBJ67_03095 [Planctomycetaceae bacterium]|jgi:hypothetical protein|nr:hypothetical protein [Planctomycetaceae bacterium]
MSVSLKHLLGFRTNHFALFYELCNNHKLDKKTKKLLFQIVNELGIASPGMIFIDPSILANALSLPSMADSVSTIRDLFYTWFGGTKGTMLESSEDNLFLTK